MVTMIMVEPVLAMTFIIGALKAGSLGINASITGISIGGYGWSIFLMLVVYLMALQAFVARQPFDITEAEIEILEGPFIEYSGPNYALFKYYMMLKQMFYASLFVMVFAPFLQTGMFIVDIRYSAGGDRCGFRDYRPAGVNQSPAQDRPGRPLLLGPDRYGTLCRGAFSVWIVIRCKAMNKLSPNKEKENYRVVNEQN